MTKLDHMKKHFVYILYSPKLNQFYRGMTDNLSRRFKEHNNAEEKFTRNGVPWKLVWYTEKPCRSEAMRLEKKLKNITGQKRLIAFIKKYPVVGGPDVPPVEEIRMQTSRHPL